MEMNFKDLIHVKEYWANCSHTIVKFKYHLYHCFVDNLYQKPMTFPEIKPGNI